MSFPPVATSVSEWTRVRSLTLAATFAIFALLPVRASDRPNIVLILADDLGAVFTGDTLFPGGPGATRWDYSSFDTIIESLEGLFTLPDDTVVHPGHGDSTTIGTEAPHLEEWIERGW